MADVGNGGSRKEEKDVTSGQHIHNTRPFSKTHSLILAMEGAEKERKMLLLVKHTYTTQDNSVKLTS